MQSRGSSLELTGSSAPAQGQGEECGSLGVVGVCGQLCVRAQGTGQVAGEDGGRICPAGGRGFAGRRGGGETLPLLSGMGSVHVCEGKCPYMWAEPLTPCLCPPAPLGVQLDSCHGNPPAQGTHSDHVPSSYVWGPGMLTAGKGSGADGLLAHCCARCGELKGSAWLRVGERGRFGEMEIKETGL